MSQSQRLSGDTCQQITQEKNAPRQRRVLANELANRLAKRLARELAAGLNKGPARGLARGPAAGPDKRSV